MGDVKDQFVSCYGDDSEGGGELARGVATGGAVAERGVERQHVRRDGLDRAKWLQ